MPCSLGTQQTVLPRFMRAAAISHTRRVVTLTVGRLPGTLAGS